MFDNTQNDLSFDEAKLDFQAMTTVAGVAVSRLLNNIHRYTKEIGLDFDTKDNTSMYLNSQRLNQETKLLVVCTETLATLREAATRGVLTIVNKPEVKDE